MTTWGAMAAEPSLGDFDADAEMRRELAAIVRARARAPPLDDPLGALPARRIRDARRDLGRVDPVPSVDRCVPDHPRPELPSPKPRSATRTSPPLMRPPRRPRMNATTARASTARRAPQTPPPPRDGPPATTRSEDARRGAARRRRLRSPCSSDSNARDGDGSSKPRPVSPPVASRAFRRSTTERRRRRDCPLHSASAAGGPARRR